MLLYMITHIFTDKDVHKSPPLDLVGWFTLCPTNGPTSDLVPIHRQFLKHNESSILVTVQPDDVASTNAGENGGKLPIAVYESVSELETNGENAMQVDGDEKTDIKFRTIPFSIETDETEMIAMDYIAKGAGSAAAIPSEPNSVNSSAPDKKGKKRADAGQVEKDKAVSQPEASPLNTDEEDQIAAITTRANSVRMLQSRIGLMSNFLTSLPPSQLSDSASHASLDPAYLPHLRNIQGLLTRLSLATPPDTAKPLANGDGALSSAHQDQADDVALSSLLADLTHDLQALEEMGRKFSTVQHAKTSRNKTKSPHGAGALGSEEQDMRPSASVLDGLLS